MSRWNEDVSVFEGLARANGGGFRHSIFQALDSALYSLLTFFFAVCLNRSPVCIIEELSHLLVMGEDIELYGW